MAAHTAGPWHVWQTGRMLKITCTGEDGAHPQEGMRVAVVHMPVGAKEWDHLWHANARLIAVAPELLALAREVATWCGGCNGYGHLTYDLVDGRKAGEDCADCADVRALIAKATQP